ncbi:mucin-19-like isoform X6 [Cucumis melo var. makuwa]|uniref:Mucin-19-like isoform X6 n=1 Tax=Cucumis melo var. makuwa TaxID=1194695 RepID=A0A5D3C3A5_CUCMM|nr:mucin-19-like isoform X6 [Cucumis melo var. makuwa]
MARDIECKTEFSPTCFRVRQLQRFVCRGPRPFLISSRAHDASNRRAPLLRSSAALKQGRSSNASKLRIIPVVKCRNPSLVVAPVDLLSVDSIEGHNQVSGKGFPTTGPQIEAGNVVIHRGLHISNVTANCSLCAIGCKELFADRHRCPDVLGSLLSDIDLGVSSWKDCVFFGITRLICASLGITRLIGVSFGITRLICASFGITRLICASFGITRLICASLGITRLIGVSFGITRLIRASFGITRLMCAFYGTTRLFTRVRVQQGVDRQEAGRMREGHMDASGFLYASADVFC